MAENTKEFLYVGHYIDSADNYILKIGTTNDLNRRKQEHIRNYSKAKTHALKSGCEFEYDFTIPLSKYNTLRFEDKNRQKWQEMGVGEYIRNDRFLCVEKPTEVNITIKKTYTINL